MAGTLYHGRGFKIEEYTANDGQTHYEVTPVDGDMDVVSISSWRELQDHCESRGIARSRWPDFDDGFDVPLDEVREKNKQICELLVELPPQDIVEFYWLEKLVTYLKRGELFFYVSE